MTFYSNVQPHLNSLLSNKLFCAIRYQSATYSLVGSFHRLPEQLLQQAFNSQSLTLHGADVTIFQAERDKYVIISPPLLTLVRQCLTLLGQIPVFAEGCSTLAWCIWISKLIENPGRFFCVPFVGRMVTNAHKQLPVAVVDVKHVWHVQVRKHQSESILKTCGGKIGVFN